MTAPAVPARAERARELYEAGLPLRRVAERLGVTHTTVARDLRAGGVRTRRRHLTAVPDVRSGHPPPRTVDPVRPAIAFTAARGWHMVETPPGWFLDLLADLD